jgi:hypothetical protein
VAQDGCLARDGHSSGTPVARRFEQPTRTAGFGHLSGTRHLAAKRSAPSLFGFAPGGVCHAACVAADAVRSYRTISPLPRLTLHEAARRGGLFSVALSLGSPPPDVIRHRMSMEPGLSSPATFRPLPERPSGRLTPKQWGAGGAASRAHTRLAQSAGGRRRGLGGRCRSGPAPSSVRRELRGRPSARPQNSIRSFAISTWPEKCLRTSSAQGV